MKLKYKNSIIKIVILIGILIIVTPFTVVAELPTELIEEKNSKADEVLIGTILGIYNAPRDFCLPIGKLKYFHLRIEKVQKTVKGLEKGDIVKVLFTDYKIESGITLIGTTPVKVNSLEKIKIYANLTDFEDEIFEPVIDGRSIEHLGFNYCYLIILIVIIGIVIGSIYLIIIKVRKRE